MRIYEYIQKYISLIVVVPASQLISCSQYSL